MRLNPAFSLGDMLALSGVLVTIGVQLATVAALRERVSRLESGAEKQGKRVGLLETNLGKFETRFEERMPFKRRSTAAAGWPTSDEEGSDQT